MPNRMEKRSYAYTKFANMCDAFWSVRHNSELERQITRIAIAGMRWAKTA